MAESRDRCGLSGWVLLLGKLLLLVSVLMMPVDIRVRLPGELRPAEDRLEVMATQGGVVAEVFVADGSLVREGQPLLRLERSAAQAQSERLREQLAEMRDEQEELSRMEQAVAHGEWGEEFWRTLRLRRTDWLQFESLLQGTMVEYNAARNDLQRAERLWSRGVVSRLEFEQVEKREAMLQARMRTLHTEHTVRWVTERESLARQTRMLANELSGLNEQVETAFMRAPVDGLFVGITPIAAGMFIMPGQRLGFISPDTGLVIEARAQPTQLARLRDAGWATVSVHALPSVYWGTVNARIQTVSGDRLPDGTYRLILQPEREFLHNRAGQKISLRRGMTAEVRLLSERRRVWSALLYNAGEWLQKDSLVYYRGSESR